MPLLGDGGQVRDFTYVRDAAEATALALERGSRGAVYNVAGGRPTTLAAAFELLGDQLGQGRPARAPPADGRDPRRTGADLTRARRDLGWEPRTRAPGRARTPGCRTPRPRPSELLGYAGASCAGRRYAHGGAGVQEQRAGRRRVRVQVERAAQRLERLPRPVSVSSWKRASSSQVSGLAGELSTARSSVCAAACRSRPRSLDLAAGEQRRGGQRVGVGRALALLVASS